MKKTKITACIAAVIVLLINVCAYAKVNIPKPTESFFVNDYANVIDADTENYIFEKGKAYNSNGGPQVVVLTLTDIGNSNVEQFSIKTAREWGIGSKDADNGVLILLVTESRDIRIEVGYGLEGILNDGKCGRFIRSATPLLSAGDYSGGLREIYDDIIGELEEPTPDEEDYGYIADILAPILIVMAVLFISMISRLNGGGHYRGGRFTGGGFYGGGFGGGGFSGGSFGGGGGFSGGGGGFGGGGASGKF